MRGLFSCFPLFSRGGGRKRRAEEAVNRCRTRDAGVPKADGGRVTDVTSRVEIGDIPSVFGRAAGRADRLRVRRPRRHFPAKSAAGAIGNPGLVMQQTPRRRGAARPFRPCFRPSAGQFEGEGPIRRPVGLGADGGVHEGRAGNLVRDRDPVAVVDVTEDVKAGPDGPEPCE